MSHQVRRNLVRKLPPHQAKSAILGDLSRCTWGRLRRPRDTVANRPPNMYGWAVSKALHRSDSSRRFSGGIAGSVSITARSIRSERVAISSIPLRTTGRVPSKLSPSKDPHQPSPNQSPIRHSCESRNPLRHDALITSKPTPHYPTSPSAAKI